MQLDLLTALRPVVAEFQRLGIAFHVGGSVASSATWGGAFDSRTSIWWPICAGSM